MNLGLDYYVKWRVAERGGTQEVYHIVWEGEIILLNLCSMAPNPDANGG